ncbi:UvrD-helicase domain-containing protein [Bradyrhizobium sp. B039]|uniref:UvrD-helicase domain-containing protein n=1 Tax=Bradyrhizobium sp. B039 TaxID=3140239 RepID=UPI003182FE70
MFNGLVIDEHALLALSSAAIENEWFDTFPLPDITGLKRIELDDLCYILSSRADEKSRLLVMRAGPQGVFASARSPRHLFDRIVHVSLSQFENGISIPVKWRSFHEGTLLSVYAQPEAIAVKQRAYFERAPDDTSHLYAYAVTDSVEEFANVSLDISLFRHALDKYLDAVVAAPPVAPHDGGAFGIILTEPLGTTLVGGHSLKEWYGTRLTAEQRSFVDHDHKTPVRLKGAAGTGKTVSLAVKCLIDLYKFEDDGRDARVAFITHSVALAQDVIPGMFSALDPSGRWLELTRASLFLGSIYELARDLLQYERKSLKPLSTDGQEGREFQAILIEDAINTCLKKTKFAVRDLAACSADLAAWIKDPARRRGLVQELINEFACVIDAENIRKGTAAADSYVNDRREPWQMPLRTEQDRQVVLDIHEQYCLELERSNVLSMDQMIADFNRYLLTHEWRQLREKNGFDLIFVDEFHYFNRAERMTLHNLFRRSAITEGRLPLFMAYDLKQAPTDAFMGRLREDAGNMFKSIGAGETELVELTQVFRSTPEIANFLRDLDGSFPALDLAGEWGAYSSNSVEPHGDVPTLVTASTITGLVDDVFRQAQSAANRHGGRQVAVLCLNDDLFGKYLKLGRIADKFVPLTSRDEVAQLKYAGKRCVFSTPDYVAGLQFHTVFLINVDRADLQDDDGIGKRRRFVSRCYLGASRAKKALQIVSNAERGGPADILAGPLTAGSLKQIV